ncbi:MAG: MFS transporter [Candidatus Bathyarchaeota archaeon]|nr:MFS transporter [Candidatus Bathyarchaeota archaeon]MDH5746130.1 MFS transporter [Candidatus Bathyarchaeota archaeon]
MRRLQLTPHSIMCMMGFSYIASSSVIAPILSIYVKDVTNAPVEMIGLVTAIFFIASALAKTSLGVFAGGKKTITFLLFAFVIFSICPALYPLTDSVIMLIVLRATQGFAYAFIGTASLILAALAISSVERDKGVGTYTASLSLGLLAGPAITTFSIPLFGVQNTFYFACLMGFVGVFAAFFLNKKISSIEKNWQIIGVAVSREALKSKISAITRNRMFDMAFIGNFAFFVLFGVILAYAPLYAKDELKFSDELVSVLFLLYYTATTVTRLSIGRIVGRVSKSTLVMFSTILAALFSFALVIFVDDLVFAGIFALIGAIQGVLFPVGSMLIAEYVRPSRNVLANSLYMMGIDVGQGIAPLITAGAIIQYGLGYGFIVSAAISAAATVLLVWLNRQARSRV